jgi:hypothetical protein
MIAISFVLGGKLMVLLDIFAKSLFFFDLLKVSKGLDKVLSQSLNVRVLLFELVNTHCIWDCLD